MSSLVWNKVYRARRRFVVGLLVGIFGPVPLVWLMDEPTFNTTLLFFIVGVCFGMININTVRCPACGDCFFVGRGGNVIYSRKTCQRCGT